MDTPLLCREWVLVVQVLQVLLDQVVLLQVLLQILTDRVLAALLQILMDLAALLQILMDLVRILLALVLLECWLKIFPELVPKIPLLD